MLFYLRSMAIDFKYVSVLVTALLTAFDSEARPSVRMRERLLSRDYKNG